MMNMTNKQSLPKDDSQLVPTGKWYEVQMCDGEIRSMQLVTKMTQTTNKQAIEESLKMWEAILEGWPDVRKHDYLKTWNPDRETWPKNYCFICEKVIGRDEDEECPGNCILDWGCDDPYACEDCEDSPYAIFEDSECSLDEREGAVVEIIRLHREALGRVK